MKIRYTGLILIMFLSVVMTCTAYAEPLAENSVYEEDFVAVDLQITDTYMKGDYPVELSLCDDTFTAEVSGAEDLTFVIEAEVTFISKIGDNYVCLNEKLTSTAGDGAKIVIRKPGAVAVYAVTYIRENSATGILEIGNIEYREKALRRKYEHSNYCEYKTDKLTKTATVTGYVGNSEEIIIPTIIDGYQVKKIGDAAFENNDIVKSIRISNGVTDIGMRSFESCDELVYINLPVGIKEIGSNAFRDCPKLADVELPSTLERLANGVFEGCDAITELSIPKNVSTIKNRALACKNLSSLVVEDGNNEYYSVDNCVVTKDGRTLIAACQGFRIPEGVTTMQGSFYGCDWLTEITIPESVTKIGQDTFSGCENLKKIEWSSALTEIGSGAFENTGFTEFSIPGTVSKLGNSCFAGMPVKEIIIPETITELPRALFDNCRQLESIVFLGDVTEIGNYAFHNCENLKSINLPEKITVIEISAFGTCRSLTEIVIPEGVKQIKMGAFVDCTGLKKIHIPSSVTEIGEVAFGNIEKSIIIYGEDDSYAEKYAADNGIAFVYDDYYDIVQ